MVPGPMGTFDVVAILVCVAAAFAYLNQRYLRLHPDGRHHAAGPSSGRSPGQLAALAWPAVGEAADAFTSHLDLNDALFHWMLGALLFAGALQVDLRELRNQQATVAVLAVVGTVLSTAIIAAASYGLLRLAGVQPTWLACAIFGAVVSPTDPVAVLGFMKQVGAPADIEAIIGGESLFNDGVGVVLFTVLSGVAAGHGATAGGIVWGVRPPGHGRGGDRAGGRVRGVPAAQAGGQLTRPRSCSRWR